MSLLAMPMVVINAGCEMMFILEQRLKVGHNKIAVQPYWNAWSLVFIKESQLSLSHAHASTSL